MEFLLDYEKKYWDAIKNRLKNEIGTAALMGNLKAESNCIPYRKQGDNNIPYTASIQYTEEVDKEIISENTFEKDSIGYGVAQWTWWERKKGLYNLHVKTGLSIGDFDLSIQYMFYELDNSYTSVRDSLINATDIQAATNIVLHDYEQPFDQSESVELLRGNLAKEIYEKYTGSEPDPTEPTEPVDPPDPIKNKKKKMPLYMYIRRRY